MHGADAGTPGLRAGAQKRNSPHDFVQNLDTLNQQNTLASAISEHKIMFATNAGVSCVDKEACVVVAAPLA